jgi:hypothetical protein
MIANYRDLNDLYICLFNFRSFQENIPPDNSEISSGSEKDNFHQKFSVAVHSSQPLVLCSDGYMVTIFHFNSQPGYSKVITELTKNVSWFLSSDATLQELEQTAGNLSAHGVSAFMAKFGKDEYSSPGSTLSETTSGKTCKNLDKKQFFVVHGVFEFSLCI